MILQAIAIDDEAPALEVLARHAAKVPFVQLQQTFTQPTQALDYVQRHPVDVIFLDIQMPDLSGTDFLRLTQTTGALFVFVTAHAEYAVEGFQLQALDYLLKPVELPRFIEACNRAWQQRQLQGGQGSSIFVKDGHDWVRVELSEVLYIRSDTNLLFIHQRERTVTTRMTISRLLELLPPAEFTRVHKSYVVALRAIQRIERHQLTVGNALIPVAASYREALEKKLPGM